MYIVPVELHKSCTIRVSLPSQKLMHDHMRHQNKLDHDNHEDRQKCYNVSGVGQ